MQLLQTVLAADPAAPRLTIYNESTGARLDFSAVTLDNWAAKVGNMLLEEFDLTSEDAITINLPPSWQAAVISLGALAAEISINFGTTASDVLFCSLDYDPEQAWSDIAIVTDDPFGRGVAEIGETLPNGCIDFGPTVRFYGDQFLAPTRELSECLNPKLLMYSPESRVLSCGWHNWDEFAQQVLAPIACGGSAVVVTGPASTDRLESIAAAERTTEKADS